MKRYIEQARTLIASGTARDTYILFIGNLLSALLGFVFIIFVTRGLSVAEFGVYSAVINFVTIIASFSDIGISSGLINFVARAYSRGEIKKAQKYIKASFLIRLVMISVLLLIVFIFAPTVSTRLLATTDIKIVFWVGGLSLTFLLWGFFPNILRARKRFFQSVVTDLSLGIGRLVIILALFFLGGLTLNKVFGAFTASAGFAMITGLVFVGTGFLFVRPGKKYYVKLLRFSGWLGVNRIVSSISGRLDIQMLAALTGATVTGYYSVSSRLSLFIVVLASSFSSVLAPRLASFGNKENEKMYIKKAALFVIPMVAGVVLWIIIAEPFITILFGPKYTSSIPVFKALATAMIPFLITTPAVSAIIYAMKKPVYIGTFSFFQIAAIFLINILLIPRIGPFAPAIAFGVVHTILAIYSWTIVIRYYWI